MFNNLVGTTSFLENHWQGTDTQALSWHKKKQGERFHSPPCFF